MVAVVSRAMDGVVANCDGQRQRVHIIHKKSGCYWILLRACSAYRGPVRLGIPGLKRPGIFPAQYKVSNGSRSEIVPDHSNPETNKPLRARLFDVD